MAKTVVLLHGVCSTGTTWWRAEQDLAELGWTVHALTLLGHGTRTRGGRPFTLDDLVADVVDQLADHGFAQDPADLVIGHSLGGIVALAVAAKEPEFARRIVLEDPPSLSVRGPEAIVAMIEDDVARSAPDPAAEVGRRLAANPSWAPRDAQEAVANLLTTDVPAVTGFLRATTWNLAQLIETCPIPVTLIAATEPATALSDPARTQILEHLGTDRYSVIESGHSIHRDRPALWLLAALADPSA